MNKIQEVFTYINMYIFSITISTWEIFGRSYYCREILRSFGEIRFFGERVFMFGLEIASTLGMICMFICIKQDI